MNTDVCISTCVSDCDVAMVKLCADFDGLSYIVTPNRLYALRLHRLSDTLELNIPFPLTYREFLNGDYCGRRIERVFIVDPIKLLQCVSDVHIGAVGIVMGVTDGG